MKRLVRQYLLLTLTILLGALASFSQGGDSSGNSRKDDFPESISERLTERRIKQEEKDYADLVKKGEEAAQLSEELSTSFEKNKQLSSADLQKVAKLEKLIKKIRQELAVEDDDETPQPQSIVSTLNSIKDKSTALVAELKKATRLSISVIAVESSNALLKLVKFLRFKNN